MPSYINKKERAHSKGFIEESWMKEHLERYEQS